MAKIYYGQRTIPKDWASYGGNCNAVELDLSELKTPPKMSTLNTWRVETPKGFCFMLHGDPALSEGLVAAEEPGELEDEIEKSWEETLERADALAAKAIVVSLGRDFQPNETNRQLLKSFGDKFGSETDRVVIIGTKGPWPTESTRQMLSDAGLVYAYDPFIANREDIEFTHGDTAFTLTERAGMRRKFNTRDIQTLLSWIKNYDRVFTLLRGRFKGAHANLFRDLLEY